MKIKSIPLAKVKAGPDDGLAEGEFLVYPSTFTRTPDSYGDIVAKGAFLDDLAMWKTSGLTMPGLYGHRMDDPDFFVAAAHDYGEDEHGWWVKGSFDLESPKGAQVYRLVKGRRLNQLSFAYDTLDEGPVTLDGGVKANELRKLKVFEFSFVPVGANQDTSVVAVKSAADALVNGLKAGRVLSSKNETTLREAQTQISAAAQQIADVLSAVESTDDQEKAGWTSVGHSPSQVAKAMAVMSEHTEEPERAKGRSAEFCEQMLSIEVESLYLYGIFNGNIGQQSAE